MRTTFDPGAQESGRSHWATLVTLMPYLWPHGRWNLRLRVILALVLLASAKIAIIFIPFIYKELVDTLNVTVPDDKIGTLFAVPIFLIIAFGAARLAVRHLANYVMRFSLRWGSMPCGQLRCRCSVICIVFLLLST